MNLKEQYEQETERNPVYQIQPHDAGFKMPSLGYTKWLETKLQTQQPEEVKPEAFWNDNQVMSFVNWYIELKNLDSRYELENQFIIDSFKAGDAAEKWKATAAENTKPNNHHPPKRI